MSTTKRPARAIGLVSAMAALLLTLSGCLKLDMNLTFNADDTVDGNVVFAVSSSLLDSAGVSFDDAFADEDPFEGQASRSEPYEDDDYVGRTYFFDAIPLADFNDGDDLTVTHADGKFTVKGELDMSSGEDGGMGMSGGEVVVKFTFPGKVESGNGTISGNSVTWSGEAGDKLTFEAVASDGSGSSFPVLPVVLAVVGLVVVAVVVVVVVAASKRRKGDEAEPFAAEAPAFPAPAAPQAGFPVAGDVPPAAPAPAAPTGEVPPAPPAPPQQP